MYGPDSRILWVCFLVSECLSERTAHVLLPHHRSGLTCSGSSSAPAAQRDTQMWKHLLFQTPIHFLFHRQRVATRPITPVFHDWKKCISRSLSPGLETNACVCLPAPSFCLVFLLLTHLGLIWDSYRATPPPKKIMLLRYTTYYPLIEFPSCVMSAPPLHLPHDGSTICCNGLGSSAVVDCWLCPHFCGCDVQEREL